MMRRLAISIAALLTSVSATAYITPPQAASQSLDNGATSLNQSMQTKTTEAIKVFNHVDYQHISGEGKASFFAGGGLSNSDSAGGVTSFVIAGHNNG